MTYPRRIFLCSVAIAVILLATPVSLAAHHPAPASRATTPPPLEMQVLLDRAGFSPGEIDGKSGKNSREALTAFQAAHELPSGARSRKALLQALGAGVVKPTVPYTITAEDAAGPFARTIPEDALAQSKLPGLYYTSVLEELGEKFHSAPALLKRLNPRARFTAGERVVVPNVLNAGQATSEASRSGAVEAKGVQARPEAIKVVVSKSASSLMVYGRNGKIIFFAPVTSGSLHDPLPFGSWKITEVRRNPIYNYNPDLFWNADQANATEQIAAGPNNPVGVVWIGLDLPHYGIHGTPDPGEIGHSASHGCVRMTNWDATIVADIVGDGTIVVFEK
jgi:lipoprotein-anchoring transpeptidase ErfK/SrfK